MKKTPFIKEGGKTKTPYPIYPHEVRDEQTSKGVFKSKDAYHSYVVEKSFSKFAFGLILPGLKALF